MKGRPVAAALLLVSCLQLTAFGQTTTTPSSGTTADAAKSEPYRPDEFPQWAKDLRRGEIIAFGTLPFTLFLVKTAIDTRRYADNDWDRRYAPWPLKPAGAIEMDEDQRMAALAAAAVSSVALAFIDHIVLRMKRASKEREAQSGLPPTITVERENWPPEVDLPAPSEDGAAPGERGER